MASGQKACVGHPGAGAMNLRPYMADALWGILEMSARRALKLAYDIEAWYRCADDAAIGAIGMEVAAVE